MSPESHLLICCAAPGAGALAIHRLGGATTEFSAAPNPSFLAASSKTRTIYVASERPEGPGLATALRFENKTFAALRSQSTGGHAAVHLCLDRTERFLFVANYQAMPASGDASLAVFALTDSGDLADAIARFTHRGSGPDHARQESPHCHSVAISPDNRRLVAADLGADRLFTYRFDSRAGRLTVEGETETRAGAGPRHAVFHPNGRMLYVTGELDSTVLALSVNDEGLRLAASLPATHRKPKSRNYPSGVLVTPDGHHLLVANRGADTIAVFWIDPQSGLPTLKAEYECGGGFPRAIRFDRAARRLAVANQKIDAVALFDWDFAEGKLSAEPTAVIPVKAPLDMLFVNPQ
ncbi:lactonase family protein [Rhizobium sp. TRM95796]|uniref:lactonase family protein n=1 Tax=Rhizobium sp. TRM95796 TaxID=2979862 RepID=UPI0021E93FE5|nr:lactonase family protein [Rhizobium sp. TRM95796]MCV3766991.1 lactonase family protein [Rhizobium sp. TRM95796]